MNIVLLKKNFKAHTKKSDYNLWSKSLKNGANGVYGESVVNLVEEEVKFWEENVLEAMKKAVDVWELH